MSARAVASILVVESDRELGQALAEQLLADGFTWSSPAAPSTPGSWPAPAPRGWRCSARWTRRAETLELLREIRRAGRLAPWDRTLPAIVVGADARELDVLRAFEAGADDFLRMTGRLPRVARAPARAPAHAHRRARAGAPDRGGTARDRHRRALGRRRRTRCALRRMEFDLLVQLAREPERVFAKGELLHAVWGYRSGGSTRTLDSHASRLRRKLAADGARRWVICVRGVGYRLI